MDTVRFDSFELSEITEPNRHKPSLGLPLIRQVIEVKDEIGSGGMGVVYLGEQQFPLREVAVKQTHQDDMLSRLSLFQEAMLTGALEHPNIIPIHSMHLNEQGSLEVVMKRVQGQDLNQLLEEFPPTEKDLRKLLQVSIQICNALEYAHSKGVIHRDIKPENIMIGDFGEVYLLDWGIAVNKNIRNPGMRGMLGTPAFMAPEMLSGHANDVDERTDVYLMGATLHYMLLGKPRHSGQGAIDIFAQIRESVPYEFGSEVPGELAKLINEACQKHPEDRVQSIALFRQRLEAFLQHRESYLISMAAVDELDALLGLLGVQPYSKTDVRNIHQYFHRARFGFEQALSIWPQSELAKDGLHKLITAMVAYYLDAGQFETASNLMDILPDPPLDLQQKFKQCQKQEEQAKKEQERLVRIGERYDPRHSFQARLVLGLGAVMSCVIFFYFLSQIESLDPKVMTPDVLLVHILLAGMPVLAILFLARKSLFSFHHGRSAAVAIGGSLFTMMLHRWIGFEYGISPSAIMITDNFIIGLAMLSSAPAIRSGPVIAFFCFFIGIVNHFFPMTFWFGTVLLLVIILVGIVGDGIREWRKRVAERT